MAFESALFGLAFCLFGALAVLAVRRARRLERDLELARDALWEAEDRAERAQAEGERALAEAGTQAEAGVRAKDRFLATVTHEMRTPLTGVIGTAGLLLESRLAPDQRTYARAISGSAEAMLRLVDEILDLSRIEAERPTMQKAPFAVTGLVEDVAELLAPRAQAKGLDLAVLVGRDVPAELVGDAARIRQILLNLAGNAIKFTATGGVGVRVDLAEGRMRFSVADTGPGFEAGEADRLFQEFEQGSTDASGGGVGLGLAISRRLAEAMGGVLVAEAEPGVGATFTLSLPASSDAVETVAARPLDGRRIVVASAAAFSGPFLVEGLTAAGAAVALADPAIGASALSALVAERGAEIALIDRHADGAAPELAAAARRGGASRVILLLAPSERADLDSLSEDGFDGYLVKPVRGASLVGRLSEPSDAPVDAAGAPVAREGSEAVAFPSQGGLRVLVAEDDPVSALIALAHLARLGHASVHVADGLAACEAFEEGAFDAVLIDVRMPRLDGLSAARRMRDAETASGRRRALLLGLSSNIAAEDRAAAILAGMDDMLAKPLDRRALEPLLAPLRGRESSAA
ncbi:hybrid sensor histidine kinase/response regulator [Hansschlegelia zhihuaiae]|uniref:histidine kinase n=1 Tax=Hansschlegelia zhihuaiae TaxID=405005 RepID=A0A4Q0MR12_9HYPH|nr:ATP-binding protein [Hansschlegelia zhihuaiae]RXF75669.1 response regulator [Hansschlegelia zhihuaiae]